MCFLFVYMKKFFAGKIKLTTKFFEDKLLSPRCSDCLGFLFKKKHFLVSKALATSPSMRSWESPSTTSLTTIITTLLGTCWSLTIA